MRFKLCIAVLLLACTFGSAGAQAPGQNSSVKLTGVGTVDAGDAPWALLTISMAPGWKTYWRSPGDAGIPPRFDWSGSINLKSAQVLWPAPRRFFDGYSHSIGYSAPRVDFPVRIEAKDPDRPVALSLLVDYAVCERVCIPERAELSGFVRSDPADPEPSAQLRAALAAVPVIEGTPGLPDIAHARRAEGSTSTAITVENGGDRDGLDLFVEGPNGEAMLVTERLKPSDPIVFSVPMRGAAEKLPESGAYRFTIVWDGGAVERRAEIQ